VERSEGRVTIEPPAAGPLTSWLFLRALGLVYVIAFASLLVQIDGLVGPRGVQPAADFLDAVHRAYGARAYWLVPTVAWLGAGTRALQLTCGAGILAAAFIILNRLTRTALAVCWLLYLSLIGAGQLFLSFQWDLLLVEAGVLAMLLPLWPEALTWLFRWLLFRLVFLSGAVKLLSGDPTWRDLTALTYHFQTQPLPNPISWYMQQLPRPVLQATTLLTFVAELFVPFLFFWPRRARHAGAIGVVVFQLLIFATGNYTFFNLLTIAMAVWLLDDETLARRLPAILVRWGNATPIAPRPDLVRAAAAVPVAVLVTMSSAGVWRTFGGRVPDAIETVIETLEPLHLTSGYGLFAVMTTTRPEIVFEGSRDGVTWQPYEFRYKPGDLRRPPPWVAPYHPRLDWQLWFAALGDTTTDAWVVTLARRLLEGSPPVLGLLDRAALTGAPPKYVRATLYEYRFTDWTTGRATGCWWSRQPVGPYLPPVLLEDGVLRRADLSGSAVLGP
jgi:lipase maturation factor 1